LNGAKGAEHRGSNVDAWATQLLPEQTVWGTRQWQTTQEKKSTIKSQTSKNEKRAMNGEGAAVGSSIALTQHSAPNAQRSDSQAPNPRPQASGAAESWLSGDPNTIAMSQGEKKSTAMRVRMSYSKVDGARFLGAKEVATMFSRAVRRAQLPIAYSQGFHPLPRLSFGPALPMGVESEEEFIDLELSEHLPAAEIGARLNAELPRGFSVQWAEIIDLRVPSIDASIRAFRYAIGLDSLPTTKREPAFLAEALSAYHTAASVPLRKHTRGGEKIVDAKPFVASVVLSTPRTLHLELRVTEAGTIKPQDFVAQLFGLAPEEAKIVRFKKIQTLFHSDSAVELPRTDETGVTLPLTRAAS
jgi:radical SAM-linked protein